MDARRIIRIAIFAALSIVGGWISLPIPFTPVKFTLQTFFVVLSGALLGAKDGMISQAVYAIMGLIGLPVFSNGGGFMYVFQPSFGYIIAFPISAFVSGTIISRLKNKSFLKVFAALSIALLPAYIIGISYQVTILALYTGLAVPAALATVPSILVMFVADVATLLFAASLYPKLVTVIKKTRPPRVQAIEGTASK